MKTFSIVTVCFNSQDTIERTFKSVLNQRYRNFEYIVIDGDSSDDTLKLIVYYKTLFENAGIPFYFISEKDRGIYDAMNKGLARSNNEWIGFLNSDDEYEKDTLYFVNDAIIKNNDCDVIFGDINLIQKDNSVIRASASQHLSSLKNNMTVFHPSLFVLKEKMLAINGFDLSYKLSADWDFIRRIYLTGSNFIYIPKVLSLFQSGGKGSGFKRLHLEERFRIRHAHPSKWAFFYDLKDLFIYLYIKILPSKAKF